MQNAQNAAEIQQRVINLVELYRTKVGKESQIAKDAKADAEYWLQKSIDIMEEEGLPAFGMYGEGPHTKGWIKHLKVNEQLLGHFYAEVAGEAAEEYVLEQMQKDCYDNTVFSEEDELFLKAHFMEMVNYIVQTPCDDSLKWVNRGDDKDVYTIPQEVLELISSRVEIAAGSRIFYPEAVFAQLTNLYQDCKFYFDSGYHSWLKTYSKLDDKYKDKYKGKDLGLYAWERIALYANKIDATFLDDSDLPSAYDAVVSYLPDISLSCAVVEDLCKAYKGLPAGGKLLLLCPPELLVGKEQNSAKAKFGDVLAYGEELSVKEEVSKWDKNECAYASFRRMLVDEKSIKEIIQLPTVCLLFVEKGRMGNETMMIDARTACRNMDSEHFGHAFDIEEFNAILKNEGLEPNTGLRKVVKVASANLSEDILIPQVYVVEKPTEAESPVPLSKLCELGSTLIRDVQLDLPEDTPWITMNDLTPLFTGVLNMSAIRRADCPNNPPYVKGSKDYAFNSKGKFIDSIFAQMNTKKGHHVLEYRQCTFIDGNSDVVLYERSVEHGVRMAIVQSTGKPYAVSKGILVFCPKDDFDANSLAALLRLPIVYRQLIAYKMYSIGLHLEDVLVPTDKLIIGDELYRMKREESVTNELGEKVETMKTEYVNEVRMRKHDMRPHLRQLASSERLMLHYINNVNNIDELKMNLKKQLEHSQNALAGLSTIVDHLCDEEKFGKSELLNIDDILLDIEVNHDDSEGFVIEYDCDNDSFRNSGIKISNIAEQWEMAREQGLDMANFIKDKAKEKLPLFINIATVDFQRLISNIIENARRHGFTDKTRDDYYIGIELSYNSERGMYQIDFTNNGNPLPEGMTKARYGLKGEKAGGNAGTGSGGYIVKSIVNHYGGDYDIFCKNGITIVRIFLPIATI